MGCVSPRAIGGEAVWKVYREAYTCVPAGQTHERGHSMLVYDMGVASVVL